MDRQKETLETFIEELQGLESRVEGSILLKDEILRKRFIEFELENVILMEETSWR